MFYIAKIAQLIGLTVLGIDFVRHFPHLMNMKVLASGVLLFIFGWIIQRFLLK